MSCPAGNRSLSFSSCSNLSTGWWPLSMLCSYRLLFWLLAASVCATCHKQAAFQVDHLPHLHAQRDLLSTQLA